MFGDKELQPGEQIFNWRNVTVLMIFALNFATISGYPFYDANTFQDFAVSFFTWFTLLCMFAGFLAMTLLSPNFFRLLNSS